MPKKNPNPEMEPEDDIEHMTSVPRSEPSSEGRTTAGQRYKFSEGCEMASELVAKLERVQKIPITREPRMVDLLAKFNDFP